MNPMWNKPEHCEQLSGFKLVGMSGQLVLLFTLMGFNSVHLLNETQAQALSPLVCPGKRCPGGYSSFCPPNEPTRCIPCPAGTFSSHHSRRTTCRPCSFCGDSEYELSPCMRTSNAVCKACSQCPSGFEVIQSCDRKRDTVCRSKCHSLVPFGDDFGVGCNKTEQRFNAEAVKKKEEKGTTKDSMTVIEVEHSLWTNGTRKPEQQKKPSPRFAGVQPTPSPYSISPHSPVAILTVPTNSVDAFPRSFDVSRRSTLGPGKTIRPSHTTKASAKFQPGSEPTLERKEPWSSDAVQDDQPINQRHIRRHVENNRTRENLSFSPQPEPSEDSMPNIDETNIIGPNIRGKHEETTTTPFGFTGVREGYEMPSPQNMSGRGPNTFIFLISGAAAIVVILLVAFLVFKAVKKTKTLAQGSRGRFSGCRPGSRPRRPRCLGSSECCRGDSVSSVAVACSDQSDRNPTTVTYANETEDLQNSNETTQITEITVDVHRNSVFDLFPAIRGMDQDVCSYPEFITSAEAIFDSSGGTLSHPDSNVSINVDSGAVPEGVPQKIFFQVVYDDTLLLRDIPKTPASTLISPVVRCGPENIILLKPVEIVLPHCLCLDETKKDSINVYKCERFTEQGPLSWQRVSSVSEKNNQSKSWFTVKMDTIHIKTMTFSFWSVFSCGGPKKKRATVFASKPNPLTDLLYLRFYIYSDNDDSKKRVERKDREQFPDSKGSKEKPFKVYNDGKDIRVWLNPEDLSNDGWEMDKTLQSQIYSCETAYKSGFRSKDSCDFAVKPMAARLDIQALKDFSCDLKFQQEDHRQHSIYVNPGFSPVPKQPLSEETDSSSSSNDGNQPLTPREIVNPDDKPSSGVNVRLIYAFSAKLPGQPCGRDDEPVTEEQCRCICGSIGTEWKRVLRNLPGIKEKHLENLEEDYRTCKVSEKCLQGLLEWRKIVGPRKATTRALYNSLQQEGCLDALEDLSKGGFGHDSQDAMLESIPE